METLQQHLDRRTWRELRATAHAHGLRFNTNLSAQEARSRLHRELMAGQWRRSFRALGLQERAALAALQAAGGVLALHRFIAAFGPIRPYKPWREDAPDRPWRRPASPAERLWFLGFVQIYKGSQGHPRTVRLPTEALDLLPPLPRPRPKRQRLPRSASQPDLLRIDLATFLGTLLAAPVPPRWHRWLPPWALKTINARLRVRERLLGVRSELHTGRLRLLHYLAEVGGLIRLQNGALLPTASAWEWLALSAGAQWRWLSGALARDLGRRNPIWRIYRFPAISSGMWGMLINHLRRLTPDQTYTIPSLLAALRPYALDDPTIKAIPAVLRGPLAWAGIVTVAPDRFAVTAAGLAALCGEDGAPAVEERAVIHREADTLWLNLPGVPQTRPWAELVAWATHRDDRWSVDAQAVARAVEQGYAAQDIARVIGDLCGGPLPREIFAQIETWARQAQRLVLRGMTVLTSPDAQLLANLRQDARLRALFAEPLSAHHAAVHPHAIPMLQQALQRRGLSLTQQTTPAHSPTGAGDLAPAADYLWLAARTYRDLSAFVDLPIVLPAALLDGLAAHLPEGRTGELQRAAETIRAAMARTIEGYAALPLPIAQVDPAAVRVAV